VAEGGRVRDVDGFEDGGEEVAHRLGDVDVGHRASALRMLLPVTPAWVTRTVMVRPGVRRMLPAAIRRRAGLNCAHDGALGFFLSMTSPISWWKVPTRCCASVR
jgi:hypothetical protein